VFLLHGWGTPTTSPSLTIWLTSSPSPGKTNLETRWVIQSLKKSGAIRIHAGVHHTMVQIIKTMETDEGMKFVSAHQHLKNCRLAYEWYKNHNPQMLFQHSVNPRVWDRRSKCCYEFYSLTLFRVHIMTASQERRDQISLGFW
jgi:hypothetical protein